MMKNVKMIILKVLMLFCLSVCTLIQEASAQNTANVRGTLTDVDGEPIIGASITAKGFNQALAITDIDGKFAFNISEEKATLVIAYIGMITKEVTVNRGDVSLKIIMQTDNKVLEEVIVVGYGQQRKETLVGAITQTNSKTLERSGGVTNLGMALTGNLPGVTTTSSTGMPGGEDPQIIIRAQTTWNDSGPLVLVDGIERPLGTLDISSVESISVLKDASATAVFGVKGANGVILITTKTGTAGKAVVRGRVNTTMKTVSRLPEKYDSYDALSLKNRVIERELSTDYSLWNQSNLIPEDILLKYRFPANDEEWDRYPNVDWERELFRDHAMSYGANASVSGGTNAVTYFASADYVREGDMFKSFKNERGYSTGYGYDRINFRSNLDFNVTKTTKLATKVFGSNGVRQFPWGQPSNDNNSATFAWTAAYRSAPDAMRPVYSDGTYGFVPNLEFDVPNSVMNFAVSGRERSTNTQLTTDFILNQDLKMITEGLTFRANYSFDNTFVENGRGIDDRFNTPQRKWIDPLSGQVRYAVEADPGTQLDFYERIAWVPNAGTVDKGATFRRHNYSGQLDYNRSFAKHRLGLMGLFMREKSARGSVFPGYREDWVFRATYNYASKYLFEANGAYNGSEKFGPDYRFDFFPSLSAGWVISNEPFMKNVEFVNHLKLRGSWGKIGSDRVSGRFLYRNEWAYGGNASMGTQAQINSIYTFFRASQLGNPNIAWENVEKRNIAVDFEVLKGFISGSLDVFKDLRSNIMIGGGGRAIPSYFGQGAPNANLGKVEGKGFELELRFNYKFKNDLRLWANTNMTRAVNKVLFRDDAELLPAYQKQAGWQLGQVRSHIESGYLRSWDDVYGSTQRNSNDQFKLPGDYNIIDFNADGTIDNFDSAPYQYAGSPQNTYNASLGFDWKGLSVFAQFYAVNNVTRNVTFPTFDTYSNSTTAYVEGTFWSKENGGEYPLPRWGAIPTGASATRYQYDGSYIRLRNAEVAYTLSGKSINKMGVKTARIYVNGNNLWLWTKMPDDRESNFSSGSLQGAYPSSRRYNLGIDLTF
jgi:TonB-linked SusC/RagA family outer membrane protein